MVYRRSRGVRLLLFGSFKLSILYTWRSKNGHSATKIY